MCSTTNIRERLFSLRDERYRDFSASLMPEVDKSRVIGVRTPILRELARELYGTEEAREFLSLLPHRYYEENNLHAFLIERIKDFDECASALEDFLPYVDNWATCDSTSPKAFAKEPEKLLRKIEKWIQSPYTYTVRYAILMLMKHFLDKDFKPDCLDAVASVKSDEYYIKMMVAWYFATALAKRFDKAIVYIREKRLDTWVHNKAIQKARESLRISAEQKELLAGLRIKEPKG